MFSVLRCNFGCAGAAELTESASNGQVSAVEILGPVFGTRSSSTNTARKDRVGLLLPKAKCQAAMLSEVAISAKNCTSMG